MIWYLTLFANVRITLRYYRYPDYIRAVYTRENKPPITESAAYVSRELGHLYDHGLYKKLVHSLGKPANELFVPFIRAVRGLHKPRIV